MKRSVLAVLATAFFISPASAFEMDKVIAGKIWGWYQEAPQALRVLIEKPKVDLYLVPDSSDLTHHATEYFRSSAMAKSLGTGLEAIALTWPGYRNPTIYFVQPLMQRETPEDARTTVGHEMTHIYDFLGAPSNQTIFRSQTQAYVKAFNEDIAETKQWARRANEKDVAQYNLHYGYYAAAPKEIFAEAGARLMFSHSNKYRWNNLLLFFPRVTAYVCNQMLRDNIVKLNCGNLQPYAM
jgi:hypothetical protein